MQDEDIIVKLWEQSYTKGDFELINVKDLKNFAKLCDQEHDTQNKAINRNAENILNLVQLVNHLQTKHAESNLNLVQLVNDLQTKVTDLTSRVEALENANKSN